MASWEAAQIDALKALASAHLSAPAAGMLDVARIGLEIGLEAATGQSLDGLASAALSAASGAATEALGDVIASVAGMVAETIPLVNIGYSVAKAAFAVSGVDPSCVVGQGASAMSNTCAANKSCVDRGRGQSGWYVDSERVGLIARGSIEPTPYDILSSSWLGYTIQIVSCGYLADQDDRTGAMAYADMRDKDLKPGASAWSSRQKAESDYRSLVAKWGYEAAKHGGYAAQEAAAKYWERGLSYERRAQYSKVIGAILDDAHVSQGEAIWPLLVDMLTSDFQSGRMPYSLANFLCNWGQFGAASKTADVRRAGVMGYACQVSKLPGATFDDNKTAAMDGLRAMVEKWNDTVNPTTKAGKERLEVLMGQIEAARLAMVEEAPKRRARVRPSPKTEADSSAESVSLLPIGIAGGAAALLYYWTRKK